MQTQFVSIPGQFEHNAEVVEPTLDEYIPIGQFTQKSAAALENVPAKQTAHEEEDALELDPAAQAMQADDDPAPVVGPYVPPGQPVQTLKSVAPVLVE